MNILEALDDPELFGRAIRDHGTYAGWRAFLAALFGLPMTDAEAELFRACTGRSEPPGEPFSEAWLVCGRRAGKSFTLALIAVFLACFRNYRPFLGPGERATIMVLAADRKQARVIFRYVRGLLQGEPKLAALIERETADALDLSNGVTIEIATASSRTTRGYTLAAVLCDEIAFWNTDEDASEPDTAILDALRPATVTIPGAMVLGASSPYARRGALWEAFRKHYGKEGARTLVWRAPTRQMNPTVPQDFIDAEYERDPVNAAAEFGAEFRSDLQSFVSREIVEACIEPGVFERGKVGFRYFAFVDPSGGSADSMTLAISHEEKGRAILDAVREARPPFSPDGVCMEFAELLKSYGIYEVEGDKYAGEWPRERFRTHGIRYVVAEKPKSSIYQDTLPLLNSGRVSLLDNKRLVSQLTSLERRTTRAGRDSIDHPPGGHDDLANAVAGAILMAAGRLKNTFTIQPFPF